MTCSVIKIYKNKRFTDYNTNIIYFEHIFFSIGNKTLFELDIIGKFSSKGF